MVDIAPLIEACQGMLQVTLNYTKKNGEIVEHTGGIYEIRTMEGNLWLWDTNTNDHIRKFLLNSINSFQVLDLQFIKPQAEYPILVDGITYG